MRKIQKRFLSEGPFIYDKIPQEKITKREFPFAEEGICQAMDWFNEEGEKMNREV